MNLESGHLNGNNADIRTPNLSDKFNSLESGNLDISTFKELEMILENAGFETANPSDVFTILDDTSLICRSESFTNLMDLVENNNPIELTNPYNEANVCTMSSGEGFRTAMTEGFAGKDVGHHIKTVISFIPNNLIKSESVARDSSLWELKPKTAQFSKIATGIINKDDLRMISCRFPIDFYPEDFLSEKELDMLEFDDTKFIVRHYIKNKPRTN
jgi:hypothetical protein